MTTVTMTYEKLYNNMANAFKVNNDPEHRPLGTYMLARAKAKKNEALAPSGSNLPATRDVKTSAISTVFSYVNDKLTVKEAPAGETRDPAPAGYKTNPLYIETRSKRLQLLVQPSLLEKLRARATREGRSLNDLIHTILEEATK